jgi:hypothetical protein
MTPTVETIKDRIRRLAEKKQLVDLYELYRIEKARESSLHFCAYVLRDPATGRRIRPAKIHRELHQRLNRDRFLVVGLPRGHGKSTHLAGYVAWKIGTQPNIRIKYVSATDGVAADKVKGIRNLIRDAEEFRRVFPGVELSADEHAKTKLSVLRPLIFPDPTLESFGIFSTATGGRCDLLIVDDPVEQMNAIKKPAEREQVKEAFFNVWMNLLTPGGQAIVVATPWHRDDLIHDLRKNPEFSAFWVAVDADLKPVWPERFPKEELIRIRAREGRAFDRGYRLVALSDEEAIFSNIDRCRDFDLSESDVAKKEEWPCFIGVDLAISQESRAAHTALFVGRVDEAGRRYPVDVVRGRFSSTATALIVLALNAEFMPEQIRVENNGYQQSILEWIELLKEGMTSPQSVDAFYRRPKVADCIPHHRWERFRSHLVRIARPQAEHAAPKPEPGSGDRFGSTTGSALPLPLVSHTTGIQKRDPVVGLPGIATEMDNGYWVIPAKGHEPACPCGICHWREEMASYPFHPYTDCVMACWFFREAARQTLRLRLL